MAAIVVDMEYFSPEQSSFTSAKENHC